MKFATIAVIAIAATTAEATCGKKSTMTFYTDAKCKTVDTKKKAVDFDYTKDVSVDKCSVVGGKTSLKTTCDTAGLTLSSFTDKACKKGVKKAVYKWGTCVEVTKGKLYKMTKGAEALKMAVTGAALALVASQF